MRIILEGGIGAGKTTLGEALANITGVPVYRPFRKPGIHITKAQMDIIRQDIGLSINGWEEDIYIADMLAGMSASVILDRSMLSALAYNETSEHALEPMQRKAVLRLWAERIADARAVLVLVEASPATRSARAGARYQAWEDASIKRWLVSLAQLKLDIPIWQVKTDNVNPTLLALDIARRITVDKHSDLIDTLQGSTAGRKCRTGDDGKMVFLDG